MNKKTCGLYNSSIKNIVKENKSLENSQKNFQAAEVKVPFLKK